MVVHAERMRENLELTCGALFSQRILLALIEQAGMVRDDAYRLVQRHAQAAWDARTPLRDLLAADPAAAALDLGALFDYGHYVRHAGAIFARLDEIA
jgi:adenylosuccinate lyase